MIPPGVFRGLAGVAVGLIRSPLWQPQRRIDASGADYDARCARDYSAADARGDRLLKDGGFVSRSLDGSAYGQWRSAATLGNYSPDGCGYDLMTQHWRRTRPTTPALRRPSPDDALRIGAARERKDGAA